MCPGAVIADLGLIGVDAKAAAAVVARPKSVTTARTLSSPGPKLAPVGTRITLEGLKSRWMTPTSWAAASASAICRMSGKASWVVIRPTRRKRSASVSPLNNSMVRKVTSVSAPWALLPEGDR